jgi:trehalose 6-phosphate phosphatase
MTPHWTDKRYELRNWLTSQPRLLIGCDFDGTLAPLASHADQAKLPQESHDALRKLSQLPGVMLAVISGRSLSDVAARVNLPGLLYAGNHGLEMKTVEGGIVLALGAEAGRWALEQVLKKLEPLMPSIPGAWIEDKRFTASVHYRQAREQDHARLEEAVKEAVSSFSELALRPGKLIWEIRPATLWHKGSALAWCMNQCKVTSQATAFMGDDVTDQDAFEVLPDGWNFYVGSTTPVNANAQLENVQDTVRLLEWMAEVRRDQPFTS